MLGRPKKQVTRLYRDYLGEFRVTVVAANSERRFSAGSMTVAIALAAGSLSGVSNLALAAESTAKHPENETWIAKTYRPDPDYTNSFDAQEQADIYGSKAAVEPPRPLLEIGRQQYTSGIYDESSTLLGALNPLLPGLAIYGDWRTAVAYNQNNGKDIAQIATRLNLDVDFKITATERLHAFFTPIQEDNVKFTRYEFGGGDANGEFNGEFDLDSADAVSSRATSDPFIPGSPERKPAFDLPFTVGLFPLFLQNGIWANDAILGGAVTLPARNSRTLGLANYDITFFAAFDNIDNASLVDANGTADNDNANLFGVTAFIDALRAVISRQATPS